MKLLHLESTRLIPRALLCFMLVMAGCDADNIGGSDDGGQGTITGTVTDEENRLVPNATISIRGAESHNLVSSSGHYARSGLQPGGYSVTVVPPRNYTVAPNTIGTVPVQIVASESKTVNFKLRLAAQNTSEPPLARY